MTTNVSKVFLYLSLPTIIVVTCALVMMWWRVPTRVQVDVLVDRVTFWIGGETGQPTRILDSIPFRSLMADSVDHAVFAPEHLEVANVEDDDSALMNVEVKETIPESVWTPVTISDFEVRLEGIGEKPSTQLTFEPWLSKESSGGAMVPVRLGQSSALSIELMGPQSDSFTFNLTTGNTDATAKISANNHVPTNIGVLGEMSGTPGATLTIELTRGQRPGLLMKVRELDMAASIEQIIQLYEPFQLIVGNATIQGIKNLRSSEHQALTLRSPKLIFDPTVTLEAKGEFVATIQPSQAGVVPLFSRNSSIPITAVSFFQQGPAGKRLTSLVARGTLRYPAFPQLPPIEFEPPDVLNLEQLEKFLIQQISFDQPGKGVRLRLHGIANTISTGSQEFSADHRLTMFDMVWNHEQFWILGAIVLWMVSTSVGFYKFMNYFLTEVRK